MNDDRPPSPPVGTHELSADAAEQQGGTLRNLPRGGVVRHDERRVHVGVRTDGPRSDLKETEPAAAVLSRQRMNITITDVCSCVLPLMFFFYY